MLQQKRTKQKLQGKPGWKLENQRAKFMPTELRKCRMRYEVGALE
jgi:hypothetical protein